MPPPAFIAMPIPIKPVMAPLSFSAAAFIASAWAPTSVAAAIDGSRMIAVRCACFYHLCVLIGQRHGIERDGYNLKSAQLAPFLRKRRVHRALQLGIMRRNLIGANFQLGKPCKCGEQAR